MGGTDAAHRPQDCYDRPRRRRTAAAGPGGAAEIPGRPDLAAAAAEQLDHRHDRRHHGRCAGPHLDQPAPKLARCPREARIDGLECEMLRAGTTRDRIRPGRQSGAGLGRRRPRLQVGQRRARHPRRPQQLRVGRRQCRYRRPHLQIHPRRQVRHAHRPAGHADWYATAATTGCRCSARTGPSCAKSRC